MESSTVLQMKGIRKSYYGNMVLKGIDLEVREGEIHALVGENGAGKSTLMNILFGMPVIYSTGGFEGEVVLNGEKVSIRSPYEAMKLGIGMVHQEFMLLPGFTITENIKLNREITKDNAISKILGPYLKSLDIKRMSEDSRKALDRLGMSLDEWLPVAGLPVGYMQFIEIAREIDKDNVKLLVFDEPTAVLTEVEAERLLGAIRMLASSGVAVLFISHRLDEVISIADNITVLRDGELVADIKKEEATAIRLAELMVGRKIERLGRQTGRHIEESPVIMKIRGLRVDMPGEEIKQLDLDIHEGEVLGIGGLAGHGKIGIANGIMGLYPAKGEVYLNNKKVVMNNPKKAMESGLAFVSEDRRGVGLLMDESIEMNIAITAIQIKNRFLNRIMGLRFKDGRKIREHAVNIIRELDIRCTGPRQIVRRLSGGNQQKVCIARALTLQPKILLVSEPTRGIDIGAKKLVLDLLIRLNHERGLTIIITSSELAELRSVCDRIAIITEGKLAGILRPEDNDAEFGLLMSGKTGEVGVDAGEI